MPDPGQALCARIRSGDVGALDTLLARDHGVAEFLVRVAAPGAGESAGVLDAAWRWLVAAIVTGEVTGGPRAALLGRTLTLLGEMDLLDAGGAEPAASDRFLPPDDPWAGWWAGDGPAAWPDRFVADDTMVAALRLLPPPMRVILVLRHTAGLTAEESAAIVGREPYAQAALLRTAVEAFVAALDTVLTEGDRQSCGPWT
jgi:hypothetical protein